MKGRLMLLAVVTASVGTALLTAVLTVTPIHAY